MSTFTGLLIISPVLCPGSHLSMLERVPSTIVGEISITTSITIVLAAGQNLVKLSILLGFEPTTHTIASIRSECLPGTRQDFLETIKQWIYTMPARVFWLYGLAGSGKSAISTTVADILRRHGLLGALVFCNRDIKERSEPSNVIRNIAYQLALFDSQICDRIVAAINNASNIAESPLLWQFDNLLVEPLLSLPTSQPIVIILDALDECGDLESRAALMDLLAKESVRLPAFIRIIVTSRGESDIRRAFTQVHVIAHEINIASTGNCEDILSFIRHQMKVIRTGKHLLHLPHDWPGDIAVRALAGRASGLFVWAVTACRFMDAHNPQKQLDILLRADVNSKPQLALDNLYKTALKATGILDDEEFCSDFRAIMGTILVARNPISYQTIDTLLCLDNPSTGRPSSHYTIDKLGCVLRWSDTEPVRILHPSFADFLKTPQRCDCDALYIDTHVHDYDVAIRCIHHLHGLKKNMFDLALAITPVEITLPAATSYACVHWIDHVCMITQVSDNLADTLQLFLFRHLLHWLEAMSLLKKSRMTIALLNRFIHWLQVYLPHRISLNELVSDATRFVQTFVSSMEDHPLLIYLSALPFTPVNSLLFRTFADQSTPIISGGYNSSWPPLLQTLNGHDRHIFALAFSPDGARVASASVDRTIRVWDLSSGISLLTLEGHIDEVFAVAFSADGSQIVSGSADKTVRLWDATSKMDILPALVGHKRMVTAVIFSLDGSRVASSSGDRTIRVWDVTTRSDIFGPLRGHRGTTTAVAFTPDGQLLLGAFDNTICGWDMITGIMTVILKQGDHGTVRALSVSSNGKYVVSGSSSSSIIIWDLTTHQIHRNMGGHFPVTHVAYLSGDARIVSFDETIRLWDIETGEQISTSAKYESMCMAVTRKGDRFALASASEVKILDTSCLYETDLGTIEERGDITTLAFSHDGKRFASISEYDHDICVWDAKTGQEACLPLEGQEGSSLTSMVFSPDGNLIGTGSVDTTIIIWDALSGTKLLLLQGHGGAVSCLAFSSDGRRLLSGSEDDTVRLWSLATYDETLHPLVMYGHEEIVSVAFHPKENQVISGSSMGSIFVWDALSGAPLFKRQVVQRPNMLRTVEYSSNGQLLMISCRYFKDRAPCMVVYTVLNARGPDAIMPLVVTPDGWIHNSNTQSVIGKLPSIVSITVYASTSSAIAFIPHDRKSRPSIIHFPTSELTKPGTSSLLESIYCGKTSVEVRNVCTGCGKYCTTYRLKA